jgi:hypothetical protein
MPDLLQCSSNFVSGRRACVSVWRRGARHRLRALAVGQEASDNGDAPHSAVTATQTKFVAETLLPTRQGKYRLRGYRHTVRFCYPCSVSCVRLCDSCSPSYPHRPSVLSSTSADRCWCRRLAHLGRWSLTVRHSARGLADVHVDLQIDSWQSHTEPTAIVYGAPEGCAEVLHILCSHGHAAS